MVFLINASNLKQGGGIQVAQSVCEQLQQFKSFHFIVVLSGSIIIPNDELGENVEVVRFNMPTTLSSLLFGRCNYLDNVVKDKKVDAVLTIFGPSRWRPRVPHLCGFARAQLVLTDSPYYQRLSLKERIVYRIWTWLFKQSSNVFYTENEYISKLLPDLLGGNIKTFTVTNYYNQVFDNPGRWRRTVLLPSFSGVTCLSVSSHYPHKNFEILIETTRYLRNKYPKFKFRFVLTFDSQEMPVPEDVQNFILFVGKVDISECPYLYEQSDIMFMPTLMECFTATYPEAMRMEVPIVTTDLDFAHSLCGSAACYFSAVDASAAAEAIYKVATNKAYASFLVNNGKEQLKKFGNYEQRAEKLIGILEEISK